MLRRYSEITEEEKKDWAHKVIEKNGKPVFEVEYKGEVQQFTPEDIASVMLKKMKETTESNHLAFSFDPRLSSWISQWLLPFCLFSYPHLP